MGPSHYFNPSPDMLRTDPVIETEPAKKAPVKLPNKLFFRQQFNLRYKRYNLAVRISNERPFGVKYEGFKFFVPRFHRNTSSFRFMWMYVSVGRT